MRPHKERPDGSGAVSAAKLHGLLDKAEGAAGIAVTRDLYAAAGMCLLDNLGAIGGWYGLITPEPDVDALRREPHPLDAIETWVAEELPLIDRRVPLLWRDSFMRGVQRGLDRWER